MIPQTVHLIWLQGEQNLPPKLRHQTNTWAEHHPDWTIRWWDHDELRALDMPYADLWDNAAKIVPKDAVNQFRSDLGRWVVLRDHGGIYSDTDVRVQKSITELLDAPLVAGWEIQDQWVGISVIAATQGHPAVEAVIQHIDTVTRLAKPGTRPNRLTGPQAITPILRAAEDVNILPERYWYPVRWNRPEDAHKHQHGAYLVHSWWHQATLRGLN